MLGIELRATFGRFVGQKWPASQMFEAPAFMEVVEKKRYEHGWFNHRVGMGIRYSDLLEEAEELKNKKKK